MGSDTKKPLTEQDAADRLIGELRERATELEFGSMEFGCTVHVDHKTIKQVDLKWPNGITKRLR